MKRKINTQSLIYTDANPALTRKKLLKLFRYLKSNKYKKRQKHLIKEYNKLYDELNNMFRKKGLIK